MLKSVSYACLITIMITGTARIVLGLLKPTLELAAEVSTATIKLDAMSHMLPVIKQRAEEAIAFADEPRRTPAIFDKEVQGGAAGGQARSDWSRYSEYGPATYSTSYDYDPSYQSIRRWLKQEKRHLRELSRGIQPGTFR